MKTNDLLQADKGWGRTFVGKQRIRTLYGDAATFILPDRSRILEWRSS